MKSLKVMAVVAAVAMIPAVALGQDSAADLNRPWGEAVSCTSCGKCVQVCPTGALYRKGEGVGEKWRDRNLLAHLVEGTVANRHSFLRVTGGHSE